MAGVGGDFAPSRILSPWRGLASVSKAKKKFTTSSSKAKKSVQKLNAKNMKPVIFPEKVQDNAPTYSDYVRVVPSDIQSSQNPVYVVTKFGDQALQNFLNSPQVQSSSVGRTASTVQNAMKADVSLGGTKSPENPQGVDHKLSLQYMALQAQTRVKYSGWTTATFNHDAKARQSDIEISEKIFKNKDLVLSQSKNETEVRNSVGVRWSW